MKKKKFWKRVLFVLILVPILLFGGILLYIQSNQSKVVKEIIALVNKEHKGLIRVGESRLSPFSSFPYLSIAIDDVQVFETKVDSSPVIVDVKSLSVGFDLWDIWEGNYDIQTLTIGDGILNVVIHENSTTNIQNFLASSSEEVDTTSSASSTNVHLKKISFDNLDIHLVDEATKTDVKTFIYNAKGGFSQKDSVTAGHIDTDFELSVIKDGDTSFINHKHFEFHTDVAFNTSSGVIDIQPSGLVMENGDFELEGSIDTKNNVDLDLAVKGTKPNFDMLIAFAPADLVPVLDKYKNAGDIYFNARVKGQSIQGHTPFIEANFGAEKAYLENTQINKKIDKMGFKGYFTNGKKRNASTMEFSLTDMTASLDKGVFEGSIHVENFESPEVEMEINSNFSLDFVAKFFNLEQVQDASGEIAMKMNFHDIIDLDHPENALQKLNQAYFAELIVQDLNVVTEELPAPLHNLNVHLIMEGKEATLDQFQLKMGNSDLSMDGYLSDLPSIVHHTDIPVEVHFNITSQFLDLAELTGFTNTDSVQAGIDEQIKDLSLGLSFKAAAKDFTESEYLPKGEFFVDSLYAELKHYPHKLHDFHVDIIIDEEDLKIIDFTGYIDDSDFHFDGLIHEYAFWMQPELKGDVDFDMNLTSKMLRLEDLFSYKGENYVPKEYRHEEFDNLALHFTSSMHYKDSVLHSIDLDLDKLDAKMKLHPLRFDQFRGNIHYEDEHIVIKDFHGEIGTTNFNFDLNYYLGEDPLIRKRDNYLELRANYIDFDALFNFNLEPQKPTEVVASKTEDVKEHAEAFNIYELAFPDMKFKVDIAHFIYHRIDLQKIDADLRITPEHYIYIDTLSMNAAGGSIALSGYFNGSDPKHIYMQPNLVMKNVDLDKLLFKFENFGQDYLVSENLKGKLTTNVTGKIRVYPDLVPDLDQSTMEMDVQVLNGQLKNYDPMLALSDYMGDKNLKNIRFDTLQNTFRVQNGKFKVPAMTIESTLGHMEFAGTHNIDQSFKYFVRIPVKMVREAAWQRLFKKKKGAPIDQEQEDEIITVDPKKKTKYLNLKIKGDSEDYEITLGKKKKKKKKKK